MNSKPINCNFPDINNLAVENIDNFPSWDNEKHIAKPKRQAIKSRLLKRTNRNIKKRSNSEAALIELFKGENFSNGESYHVISGGDIDSLSFLKIILNKQRLEYCLFSTWCMAMEDVLQLEAWIDEGKIKRIDAYVGEIFPNTYALQYQKLKEVVIKTQGRVAVFRNHAKIYAGIGDKFAFAIASSANVNTNPRVENTCVSIDKELYLFYKDFFDGIHGFNRDCDNWVKYETGSR